MRNAAEESRTCGDWWGGQMAWDALDRRIGPGIVGPVSEAVDML